MAFRHDVRVTGLAVPFALTMALTAFAQPQTYMPVYDKQAEVTVTGRIVELTETSGTSGEMQGAGTQGQDVMPGMPGLHVILKTDDATFIVYLGPTAYVREQQIELAIDDTIQVIGARTTMRDGKAILVRELRKGNQSWFLRDAQGRPWWRISPS
jgi:hypothetical protein